MEDNLNILKVEYLSNPWLDFPQILKLSLEDQTKINKAFVRTRKLRHIEAFL